MIGMEELCQETTGKGPQNQDIFEGALTRHSLQVNLKGSFSLQDDTMVKNIPSQITWSCQVSQFAKLIILPLSCVSLGISG